MLIYLNDFLLNDPAYRVRVKEPIEGLDYPPIRTSRGVFSGRDGGYVGAQFLEPRPISISGDVFSADIYEAKSKRRMLQAALPLYPSIIEVKIVDDDGAQYALTASLIDFKMPIERSPLKSGFKIELVAPDPYIYDNATGGSMTVTIPIKLGGGVVWPMNWPVIWQDATQPTTVVNTGDVPIYPKLTLTGTITNPTIRNLTTGQFFTLSDLTTSEGDVVTIDMKARTVLLNGGSILTRMTTSSSWWPVLPGANAIEYATTDIDDAATCDLTWQAAFRGI